MILPSSAEERFQRLRLDKNHLADRYCKTNAHHNSCCYRQAKTVYYESSIVALLCIIPRENPNLDLSLRLMDTPLFTTRFFSSETGVGIGCKTTALRLIPSFFFILLPNSEWNKILLSLNQKVSISPLLQQWMWGKHLFHCLSWVDFEVHDERDLFSLSFVL